eukprot:7546420-Alexandrium_andersonii.AAC.1
MLNRPFRSFAIGGHRVDLFPNVPAREGESGVHVTCARLGTREAGDARVFRTLDRFGPLFFEKT